MKRFVPVLLAGCMAMALVTTVAYSGDASAKKASKGKDRYLIMSTHTQEECLKALDDFAGVNKALSTFDFGCEAGDHTGYAIVTASSDQVAREMLPTSAREGAKVVKLHKFSAAEIKSFHEKMAGEAK